MSHRNKNLVFTITNIHKQNMNVDLTIKNDNIIKSIDDNSGVSNNPDNGIRQIQNNSVETNNPDNNTKPIQNNSNEPKKRTIPIDFYVSKKNKLFKANTNKPRRSKRIAKKFNKNNIMDNNSSYVNNSISDSCNNDIVIDSTNNFICNTIPEKNFTSGSFDIDFILSYLEKENWFNKLEENNQDHYIKRMGEIISYKKKLPSLKEIMDLDNSIGLDNLKILISNRLNINELDMLSSEYDQACHQFYKKFLFYTNNQNFDKHAKIRDAENNILENPNIFKSIRERILSSNIDIEIKTIIYEKYITSPTSEKCKKWINTILSLPQESKKIIINENMPKNKAISLLIEKIMCKFDEQIYGMQEAKEEFICFITNIICNPLCKNKAIGICGPPGVGKTMIARVVADTLELPMEQIALGGITDSQFLEGHGYTYIGSEPGQIVKSITKMKYTNGIIFLDEIDKISKTNHGKEVEHSLLHIIDFTQNHNFRDKYISDVPIDLSNYIFVYSMNSTECMDSALLSRIPVIKIDGYSKQDKEFIINDHILPEILKNYSLNQDDIILDKSAIEYLINNIKEEDEKNGKSGVRGLKKAINRIIGRFNLYKLASIEGKININLSFDFPNFSLPYIISINVIQKILANSLESDNNHNMYI